MCTETILKTFKQTKAQKYEQTPYTEKCEYIINYIIIYIINLL